ncbi:hypothetical protein FNF31_03408 [Cafeteria roenbergensis]|uniref:Uncharacterized protein n=1 Tax=Cafeteria roenbergensis TaxID=33653 RepID=A0A5A8D9F8_CAFRO|nr:hypothetical protein FNF31_03408 [Cafeteria roenbergensis]
MALPDDLQARIMLLVETPGSPSIAIKRGRSTVTTTRRVVSTAIYEAVVWAVRAGVLIAAAEFATSPAARPYGVDSAMHLSDSKELQSAMRSLGMSRKNAATEFSATEFPCMPKNPLAMVQWIEHARQSITAKLLARGREALRRDGLKPAQITKIQAEGVEGAVLRGLHEKLLALGAVPKSSTVKQLSLANRERTWIRDITTPCAGSDAAAGATTAAAAASTPAKAAPAAAPRSSSSGAAAAAATKSPAAARVRPKGAVRLSSAVAAGVKALAPKRAPKRSLASIANLEQSPKRAKMNDGHDNKEADRPSPKPSAKTERSSHGSEGAADSCLARRTGPTVAVADLTDSDPQPGTSDDEDERATSVINSIRDDHWGVNRVVPWQMADAVIEAKERGRVGPRAAAVANEMQVVINRFHRLTSEPGAMIGAIKVANVVLGELTTFILGARTAQERLAGVS